MNEYRRTFAPTRDSTQRVGGSLADRRIGRQPPTNATVAGKQVRQVSRRFVRLGGGQRDGVGLRPQLPTSAAVARLEAAGYGDSNGQGVLGRPAAVIGPPANAAPSARSLGLCGGASALIVSWALSWALNISKLLGRAVACKPSVVMDRVIEYPTVCHPAHDLVDTCKQAPQAIGTLDR